MLLKLFTSNTKPVLSLSLAFTVTSFHTLHNGMGQFRIIPQNGEIYTAVVDNQTESFSLPQAVTNCIALQATISNGAIQYQLKTTGTNEKFIPSFCIAQMQNKVLLKQSISSTTSSEYSGTMPVNHFRSGILQLTFFNKDNAPLAERLFFIGNKEYQLSANLKVKTLTNASRKKNSLEIELPEEVDGNFSIAITDADFDQPGNRKENIITSLLLSSDLPGYIENPAWYFSNDPKATAALDLLMLTNGWRRFKWIDLAKNNLPKPTISDPGYISLSGQAVHRNSKNSFADRDLLMWTTAPGSGPQVQLVKTDSAGRFKMNSMVFFDKAKILFSDVMGKKNKFITVQLNTDSLYKTFNLPALQKPASIASTNLPLSGKMQSAFFDYSLGQGLLLDNISIEGRRMTQDELEQKYVHGIFAGNINSRTINLSGQFIPQWNIFEWLTGRVPSLNIQRVGNFGEDYRLFFRQQPVQLFLDEMPMNDAGFITSIPANQLALIKIFPQFIGARGNGAAVAFYTKRFDDMEEEMETSGSIIDYDGYSIIKEYFSPDYSAPSDIDYKDYRLTLNWQPEIILSNSKTFPVSFYNNDRTKRFKIVAEGFTKEGKLLMLEKVIEPEKK